MPSLPVHKLLYVCCLLALLSALYLCATISSNICFTPHISHGDHDQSKSDTLTRMHSIGTSESAPAVNLGDQWMPN